MTSQSATPDPTSLFDPGRNCWKVATAEKYAMVVDGAAYFKALREALIAAERQVMLIGWDFDLEIEMLPGESDSDGNAPDGYPNVVLDFIEAVVDRNPELMIYLLRWTGSALIAPGRIVPALRLKLVGPDRIKLALDGRHPVGACHHQKIVVVDDRLAFCGGIDVTDARWDTPDHTPNDPRRVLKDGSLAPPWHDVTNALCGPAARALGDLARIRWHRATDEDLPAPKLSPSTDWPASLAVDCTDIPVAISRTHPPDNDRPLINEIEAMILASIAAARTSIYLESQYFASDAVADALATRLRETGGPDIVVINPVNAPNAVEDKAMHVTRTRMVEQLLAIDHEDRFRIFSPFDAADDPIYVHAKVCVIDECSLRVGSSNINRRSMGFDTECDLTIEATDTETRQTIAGLRNRLLAEHLDCTPEALADEIAKTGRILPALLALNSPSGRGLRAPELKEDSGTGAILSDTRMLDPRFEDGTQKRTVLTSRHIAFGIIALVLIAAVTRYLWA